MHPAVNPVTCRPLLVITPAYFAHLVPEDPKGQWVHRGLLEFLVQ